MLVRIIKAKDSMYWYADYIGEVFSIYSVGHDRLWTHEPNSWHCLNFILKEDCIVEEEEQDYKNVLG